MGFEHTTLVGIGTYGEKIWHVRKGWYHTVGNFQLFHVRNIVSLSEIVVLFVTNQH
jgi:hypothetical protein